MNALAVVPQPAAIEQALIQGDLSKLNIEQRLSYYKAVCESVGLNPLTKPFDYLSLNGKLVLYAKRDATDQLRKIHAVSVTKLEKERIDDVYVVTAYVKDKTGREDSSTGAVTIGNLKGDALANCLMKAETKAKRRATLSICGLGLLDETEVATIPDAKIPTMEELQAGATEYETKHPEILAKVEAPTRHGYELPEVTVPVEAQALGLWPTEVTGDALKCFVLSVNEIPSKYPNSVTLEVRHMGRDGSTEVGTRTAFVKTSSDLYSLIKASPRHNCTFRLEKSVSKGKTYLNIVEMLGAEVPEASKEVNPVVVTDDDIPF